MTIRRPLRSSAGRGDTASVSGSILQVIRDNPDTNRADAARELGLSPATVTAQVRQLMLDGIVIETGQAPSSGGKPPTMVAIDGSSRQVAVVEVGQERDRGALVDLNGNLVGEPIEAAVGPSIVDRSVAMFEQLVDRATAEVIGLGATISGVIDGDGNVRQITRSGRHMIPLGSELSERFGLPALIVNDADALAVAEFAALSSDVDSLVALSVEFGIGAGLVLDGRLRYGDNFTAGEIGHIRIVSDNGNLCVCGRRGCLEAHASPAAMAQSAGFDGEDTPAGYVSRLLSGDHRAAIESGGRRLGQAIGIAAELLDVSYFAICGEVRGLGDDYLEAVRSEAAENVLPDVAERLTVEWSVSGDYGPLLGAAGLVRVSEMGFL